MSDFSELLASRRTDRGHTLAELSAGRTVLVLFLRHLGCSFCREMLAEVAGVRDRLRADGTAIVIVHMGSPQQGDRIRAAFGLDEAESISDPQRELYKAFDLQRGRLGQLISPRLFLRGLRAIFAGHWPRPPVGDPYQLAGSFLLRDGKVVKAHRSRDVADHPDFADFACSIEP